MASKTVTRSICSRQFQFYSQPFQIVHDNFNWLTAISILFTAILIYSRQFQFYSRQFQLTHGNFNFFTATRLAHGIFRFAHHLSATAADSGHQKSKPKIKSRYLKSIFKEKSENQKSKVDLRTLLGHRKNWTLLTKIASKSIVLIAVDNNSTLPFILDNFHITI